MSGEVSGTRRRDDVSGTGVVQRASRLGERRTGRDDVVDHHAGGAPRRPHATAATTAMASRRGCRARATRSRCAWSATRLVCTSAWTTTRQPAPEVAPAPPGGAQRPGRPSRPTPLTAADRRDGEVTDGVVAAPSTRPASRSARARRAPPPPARSAGAAPGRPWRRTAPAPSRRARSSRRSRRPSSL